MEITKVNVRFDKFHAETDKAYLLEYRRQEFWIPKKYCWSLGVYGNDKHAWAVMPVWFVNLKFEIDVNMLYQEIGQKGLREYYDIDVHQIVEKHVPERKEPVKNNTIKDLKR